MFQGSYPYKVDDRGRVPFPPEYREQLQDGVVLVRGPDPEKCIYALSKKDWEELAGRLRGSPLLSRSADRQFRRAVIASSYPAEFDSQGRVGLPAPLREYGEIDKVVIIAGMGDYVEIWSEENWNQATKTAHGAMWDYSEKFGEQGR